MTVHSPRSYSPETSVFLDAPSDPNAKDGHVLTRPRLRRNFTFKDRRANSESSELNRCTLPEEVPKQAQAKRQGSVPNNAQRHGREKPRRRSARPQERTKATPPDTSVHRCGAAG
ncbi:unnamed protein product [Lampetra fluviatilis]